MQTKDHDINESRLNYFRRVEEVVANAAITATRADALEDIQEARLLGLNQRVLMSEVAILSKKLPTSADVKAYFSSQGYEWRGNNEGAKVFFKFNAFLPDVPELIVYYWINGIFKIYGVASEVLEVTAQVKKLWPSTHAEVKVARGIDNNGRLQVSTQMASIATQPIDYLFPFIKDPLDKFIDDYLNDSAEVLLLIGPPGTGKSSFLRYLITRRKLKVLMSYERNVIESPTLFSHARDQRFDLLALEDADNFVQAREKGNNHMASLLNDTQGVTDGSNLKVVISTNLETLNHVDRALLRKGRCFSVLPFRPLTRPEIEAIWKAMEREPVELEGEGPWTLSDALNPEHYFDTDVNMTRTINPIGFMSSR